MPSRPRRPSLAELESDIDSYNGTYANVTTKAMRPEGFVMTGTATAKIVSGTTAVAVTVKRVVAKKSRQCIMTDAFRSKYGNGCIQVNKITLSKGAEKSYLIDQTTSKYATVSSTSPRHKTHTATKPAFRQPISTSTTTFSTSMRRPQLKPDRVSSSTSRLSMMPTETSRRQTTNCRFPTKLELTGATGGKIVRNGSYKVNAKLDGLTGQDITLAITVANWEALVTQDVNLGQ